MTQTQADAYRHFLASEMATAVRLSSDPCDCGSGGKRGWCCHKYITDNKTSWQALVFPVIISLQKISNHLALLIPNGSDTKEKQERDMKLLKEMLPDRFEELYKHRDSMFQMSNPDFCGKGCGHDRPRLYSLTITQWNILKRLLKFWYGSEGNKVLIFSHSVRLLKLLQHLFGATTYNISFLDGSMTPDERQRAVDDFNTDPQQYIFLISTKSGGLFVSPLLALAHRT